MLSFQETCVFWFGCFLFFLSFFFFFFPYTEALPVFQLNSEIG